MTMSIEFNIEGCPICGKGRWIPHTDGTHIFTHKRKKHCVSGLHYALCDKCGARGFLPGQVKENRRLIAVYEDNLHDYISPSKVLALREKYSISQKQAAKIFGCGDTAFSKWERGVGMPTGPTAVLLRSALKNADFMVGLANEVGEMVSVPVREKEERSVQPPKIPDTEHIVEHWGEVRKRFLASHKSSAAKKTWLQLQQGGSEVVVYFVSGETYTGQNRAEVSPNSTLACEDLGFWSNKGVDALIQKHEQISASRARTK